MENEIFAEELNSFESSYEADLNNDGINESIFAELDTDSDSDIDLINFAEDKDNDGEIDKQVSTLDNEDDGEFDFFNYTKDIDNDSEIDRQITAIDEDSDGEFDYEYDNSDIIGDPDDYTEHWHMQQNLDTCAVVAQEFILDDIGEDYGIDFSEEELMEEAIENGWYTSGGGTALDDVGKLLEANGVEIEINEGCTLEDLENKLEDGQKIIVGIDSDEIWYSESDFDDSMYEALGMPGQAANHAVQVIGIDNSDPENPVVILNDPGTPDGKGLRVPADEFVDAWEDSDHYMMSTTGNVDVSLLKS
ncbi:hypothetical protein [Calothrix sp. CCY 0018]|uniref:hypothetical protein n=1 Tax=Calothrix sp. CCY 0018 TaxID=3103864 RepID=UPI0039C6938A